jgi:hypothetical protein
MKIDWGIILPTAAAFGAFVTSLLNRNKIQQVHLSINSRMEELLKQKGIASKAEGKAEAVAEHKEQNPRE